MQSIQLGKLSSSKRKGLAKSTFALPGQRKYPLNDISHARNALARASGKPEEATVRAAVYKKFPSLKKNKKKKLVKAAEDKKILTERFILSPLPIRLTEDDQGIHVPNKVQLFKTGTFKKFDPQTGTWIAIKITTQTLSEIVENWKSHVRGVDLAIDFSHRSDDEAAGWIKDLSIVQNGKETQLWAEVDWTPDGHRALAGKKFRYLSPDFAFSYTDNETGESYGATLFGAGLTNRPVIKNMAPAVELTEVEKMAKKKTNDVSKMTKEELEILLSESKDPTLKSFIQYRLDEMAEYDEDGDDDENPDDSSGGDSASDEGNDDGDSDDGDENQPAPKKKKSSAEKQLADLTKAHGKLLKAHNDLKSAMLKQMAETKKEKKTADFNKLMSEGKVVEAQREAFMEGDTVKFAELAGTVKFGTIGAQGAALTGETSAQDEVLKLADERAKKEGGSRWDKISVILSENPALEARYIKETEAV